MYVMPLFDLYGIINKQKNNMKSFELINLCSQKDFRSYECVLISIK
ncbi:hypothetical protein SAMN06265350_103170 [Solitalea koreensis]|uniref:Uncharacterized protein n=1 Tax=Solitalea koreensis TaxID=543615 RepID=A0A521C2V1_9SPHI|nr:hypothetical protein SAMN06265350_103170 [Solitalea koreensis]